MLNITSMHDRTQANHFNRLVKMVVHVHAFALIYLNSFAYDTAELLINDSLIMYLTQRTAPILLPLMI